MKKTFTLTLLLATLTFSAFATQNKNTLKLRLQSTTTGYLDETTVFFDEDIAPVYNSMEDAYKVFSNLPNVPAIYSFTNDQVKCSTNGYGNLGVTQTVPLGYKVKGTATYKIIASDISNFDPTCVIRLEDKQTGVFTDLRANFYQVQLTEKDSDNGRFYLHITRATQFASTNAGCLNNDGTITLQFDNSITWDMVQLADNNNNVLGSYTAVSTPSVVFNSLPEGDYVVSFVYGSYLGTRNFHLTGNHVMVNIATMQPNIVKGEEVTFNSNATHATNYTWDFGDGSIITGVANPSLAYLQTGNFTVTLNASNSFGCSASAELSVSVGVNTGIKDQDENPITVFASHQNVTINLNDVTNVNARYTVFNLLGQPVYTDLIKTQKVVTSLDDVPNGYYMVSVNNGGKINTTRVYLSK